MKDDIRLLDLPLKPGDPPFSAWGYWGPEDEIGTLNWLSKDVVRQAAAEIVSGAPFSLNWGLNMPTTAGFGRHECRLSHTIYQPGPMLALDEEVSFNTQRSSQWDGQRHFAYQKEQLFYNGVKLEEILSGSSTLGMQNWHKAGGLAGRAILLDYWSYTEAMGETYDAAQEAHAITFDNLMACLQYQQNLSSTPIIPRQGDFVLIRSGFTHCYQKLKADQERAIATVSAPITCGVEQDVRMLEWLWEHRIAAVGGDAPAWEVLPPTCKDSAGFLYHEVLIAGWGCPIAEYLWLEDLAEYCKREKRWTMFLSSCPLNVQGGVASPANLMAIL